MTEDLQELTRSLADFLSDHGLPAFCAWPDMPRLRPGGAVAAVSLLSLDAQPPGLQDFLGDTFNESTGRWEERYGKKAELTFAVDVYGQSAETVRAGVNTLSLALCRDGPDGMRPLSLHVGETAYQDASRRYRCPAQVRLTAWLTAVRQENGSFLDVEIHGTAD